MDALWRVHKSRLKAKHYDKYETDEERLKFRPKSIPINQFEELLEYWNSELSQDICKRNTRSCGLRSDMHTMGPSSYALLRHELQQEDQNKLTPTQAKVYKESRKRDPDRMYKTNNEKTLQTIEEINVRESQHEEGDDKTCDPYCEVVDNGHLRLYGRSMTKSKLKIKPKDQKPSYICPPEFLESFKQDLICALTPKLTTAVVSSIQAANPGIQLNVPDFLVTPRDTTGVNSCQLNEETTEQFKDNEGEFNE
ncbi:unnamed protein product [Cuscuta epithymum]|uniref:Uncharacterized protein n=1 Tax=Cuscuta epithymum TaxID=186058 RepID=A0AAV0CGR3_9ASTE|nr:unnamed protein product [Cuscuta epithymum]